MSKGTQDILMLIELLEFREVQFDKEMLVVIKAIFINMTNLEIDLLTLRKELESFRNSLKFDAFLEDED